MDVAMQSDDEVAIVDAPQAKEAAAAQPAPPRRVNEVWPPGDFDSITTWGPAPWRELSPEEAAVKAEKMRLERQTYVTKAEGELKRAVDQSLKEMRTPTSADQLKKKAFTNGKGLTMWEAFTIKLEAIQQIYCERDKNSYAFLKTKPSGFTVPPPGKQTRGQHLQAAATGGGGKGTIGWRTNNHPVAAPQPFGAASVEKQKQTLMAGFQYGRDGASGGGGRQVMETDLWEDRRHGSDRPGGGAPRKQVQPIQQTGSGRRSTRKRSECEACHKQKEDVHHSEGAGMWLCARCRREIGDEAGGPLELSDDDDAARGPIQSTLLDTMVPAQRDGGTARTKASAAKRKAQAEPETVDLVTDDERDGEADLQRALALSRQDQEKRHRPQRTAAVAAQSLAQQLHELKALYPTPSDPEAVEIGAHDLRFLEPNEFLNDNVIDMYLLKIKARLSPAQLKKCHFFNTFFYKKLCEKDTARGRGAQQQQQANANAAGGDDAGGASAQLKSTPAAERAYERVKRWTKGVNLLEKEYIVVPIHKDLHWSLAIICHPWDLNGAGAGIIADADAVVDLTHEDAASAVAPQNTPCPIILHLDSMPQGHPTTQVVNKLKEYLQLEYATQKLKQMQSSAPAVPAVVEAPDAAPPLPSSDGLMPGQPPPLLFPAPQNPLMRDFKGMKQLRLNLPQQDNTTDCGCFLLVYVQHFCENLPDKITHPMVEALERKDAYGGIRLPEQQCPFFMGPRWFHSSRGFLMRILLRAEVLDVLIKQYKLKLTAAAGGPLDAPVAAGEAAAVLEVQEEDPRLVIARQQLESTRKQAEADEEECKTKEVTMWKKGLEAAAAKDANAGAGAAAAGGGGDTTFARKPARGKGKPGALPLVTLCDSDGDADDEDLPPGLHSKGDATAAPAKRTQTRTREAPAAAHDEEVIHVVDNDDDDFKQKAPAAKPKRQAKRGSGGSDEPKEEVGRRSNRLQGKAQQNLAESSYQSSDHEDMDEDKPVAQDHQPEYKRLRKKSKAAVAEAEADDDGDVQFMSEHSPDGKKDRREATPEVTQKMMDRQQIGAATDGGAAPATSEDDGPPPPGFAPEVWDLTDEPEEQKPTLDLVPSKPPTGGSGARKKR